MNNHRPPSTRFIALIAALLALSSVASAVTKDEQLDRERKFAERTAQVLLGATKIRRPGGVLKIAVVGASPSQLAPAREVARLIDGFLRRMQADGHFETDATTLPEQRGAAIGDVSAVVIVDTTWPAIHSLEAFAVDKNVLTISRRPQDIGLVSLVILLTGEMYLFDDRLREEEVILPREMTARMQPARTDYEKAYNRARTLQMNRSGNWIEIVKQLRMALTAQPAELRRHIEIANGTINNPYVPRFFLSEALAMIGDCQGASLELQNSDPRKRASLEKKVIKRVTDAVVQCPGRVKTNVGAFQMLEDAWATGSL